MAPEPDIADDLAEVQHLERIEDARQAGTFAVVPAKPGGVPVVRELSLEDAESAARDRNDRPSTRRGLNAADNGPGRYVVRSDAEVEVELGPAGLQAAKDQLHRRRDQNRAAAQRRRERLRG